MLKFEKYIAFYFFKPTFPTLTVKFGQSPSYRCFESFLKHQLCGTQKRSIIFFHRFSWWKILFSSSFVW